MRLEGWHLVILVLLAVLLFGAPKLPGLARSVGQSLRIFRSEVRQMKDENPPSEHPAAAHPAPAAAPVPAPAENPAAASDLPPAGPVTASRPAAPGPLPVSGPGFAGR